MTANKFQENKNDMDSSHMDHILRNQKARRHVPVLANVPKHNFFINYRGIKGGQTQISHIRRFLTPIKPGLIRGTTT